MKKKTRRKKTPRQKLYDKLDNLCREAVKLRDEYKCQKCGKSFSKIDWSHVEPRGNKRLRWDLNNSMALCSYDHNWWWHANPVESGEWFKKKFPERWEYIVTQKHKGCKKWSLEELEDMVTEFEKYIKELNNEQR